MTALSNELQDKLKEFVLNYLQGESPDVTLLKFQKKCNESKLNAKTLLSLTLIQSKNGDDPSFKAILRCLNIKAEEQKSLLKKSRNFYQLLISLFQSGHMHIEDLLKIVDKSHPQKNRALTYFWSSLLIAGTGIFLHYQRKYISAALDWFNQKFPLAVTWLGKTFSKLRNLSLIGIISNSLLLGWNWYKTFSNEATSTRQKLSALAFKTLTGGLTICAYALSYLSGGAVTMAAVILFTLSASVDIFESLYRFYSINERYSKLKNLFSNQTELDDPLNTKAEFLRAKNFNQRTSKTLWVKLCTGGLTMLAVGIWNLYPPNWIVTMVCVSFTFLLSLGKKAFVENNDETESLNLQKALEDLYTKKSPDCSDPHLANSQDPSNSNELMLKQLKQQTKEILDQHTKDITGRMQGIEEHLQSLLQKSAVNPPQPSHSHNVFFEKKEAQQQTLRRCNSAPTLFYAPVDAPDESHQELSSDLSAQNALT